MKKGKKKKHTFKKWTGKLHLWLGLLSGAIVLLLALTGCLFSFSTEITEQLRKDVLYVEPAGQRLPFPELWQKAQQHIGEEKPVSWAYAYNSPRKAWIFYSYKTNPEAITYFGNIKYYKATYVNPYNGKVLGVYDEKYDFFNVVKFLHWSLLLRTGLGQPIVGWATFIFALMLLSGIVLWWPRNKKAMRQRFSFDWKKGTGFKRKNYDLHNIPGFYVLIPALILAITGMVFAFTWMNDLVYTAGAGTSERPKIEIKTSDPSAVVKKKPLDQAFSIAAEKYPGANGFRFTPASGEKGVISVYVQQYDDRYYKSHALQFDQYSGKLLAERKYDEKNFGEKIIDANYDIHVGAILGIPGKLIAFLASLVCASLPVTGFLIWWKRKKRMQYLVR